jgi:hypothetical protein
MKKLKKKERSLKRLGKYSRISNEDRERLENNLRMRMEASKFIQPINPLNTHKTTLDTSLFDPAL